MLKKIIAIASVSSIMLATAATSALAYVRHNQYNANYSFSYTGNEMTMNASGGINTASTSAGINTGYSRYLEVAVSKRKASNNAYITGNSNSATVSSSGIGTSIARNRTDTTVYYKHTGVLKPDASNSYTIDSYVTRVFQYSDETNF